MASKQLVLFDIPTKDGGPWSLNPWKTRMLLNYKGIDYKTEWLEYPDIEPRLKDHVPPNPKGTPYTIPTVMFPDGTYVMDSRKIADAIDERYPDPPIDIKSRYLSWFETNNRYLMNGFEGVYVPSIPKRLLGEASKPFWYRTREEDEGRSLDQLEREKGGEVAYANIEPQVKEITALLKENPGPFFSGKDVTYADFVWGGFLIFCKAIGEDVLEGVLAKTGDAAVHTDLLEALRPWTARDY